MEFTNMHPMDETISQKFKASVADFLSADAYCSLLSPEYVVFPGFCDVHVHFREPGFSYKETMESGSAAAAHGGYTAVCTMPNLKPVPDSRENLRVQTDRIREGGCIHIYLVWDGAAVLMRIPEERRFTFTIAVSALVILVPFIMGTIMSGLSTNLG